jgi:hypothetical protein
MGPRAKSAFNFKIRSHMNKERLGFSANAAIWPVKIADRRPPFFS